MNWKTYFKLGVVHFMLYPESMQRDWDVEGLEAIALDPYFEAVELCGAVDPQTRRLIKPILEGTGLEVILGAQPTIIREQLNLCSSVTKQRLLAVNHLKEQVDAGYELGATRLVVMDGLHSFPGDDQQEAAQNNLAESLHEVCAYAQSQGDMAISLENYDRAVEKRCLFGPLDLAVAMVREIQSDHCCLGLTLDLAHLALEREPLDRATTITQDVIAHVHLGNAVLQRGHPLFGDSHPPIGVRFGEIGLTELAAFLRLLTQTGFLRPHNRHRPVVSFEVGVPNGGKPAWTLAHCKRVLDQAWTMIG